MAMSLGLLGLYVGLAEKATIKTSVTCGVLALLCFVTYNGYWSLAGFAMIVHVIRNARVNFELVRRALWTAIGFMIPLALLFLLLRVSGINLFSEYGKFAKTIDQGSYMEGWSLPFEYFWHSEHAIILILGGLSLWAIVNLFRRRNKYTGVWVAGLVVIGRRVIPIAVQRRCEAEHLLDARLHAEAAALALVRVYFDVAFDVDLFFDGGDKHSITP